MNRRKFLTTGALATGALAGLSGCLGDSSPPPRKSKVFEDVAVSGQETVVQIEPDVTVRTRADVGAGRVADDGGAPSIVGLLSPVGVASAGGRGGRGGRGATGRGVGGYSSAPKNHNGHAIYHGKHDDDDWYEEHEDEIDRYDAEISKVGFAYLGPDRRYEDDPPGIGRPNTGWDDVQRREDFEGETLSFDHNGEGWYRVGTQLVATNGSHNFGWENLDYEIDDGRVEEHWKLAPQL